MLKKIDKYIFGQVLRALGFSLLALVGMFWIGKTIPLIELVILRGESVGTFFRLSSYLLPSIIKVMLPIAALIAVIFTLNRMSNDGEIMSIHNSGRDPFHILIPITLLGTCLCAVSLLISIWLAPAALYGLRSDLENISQNYSKNVITAQKFLSPDKNLYIYVEDSVLSGEMLNIFIDDRRSETVTRNYFADRALLIRDGNKSKLALINGEYHDRDTNTGQVSIGNFERLEVELDVGEDDDKVDSYAYEEMPMQNLLAAKAVKGTHSRALGELVDRLLFPVLNIILAIIGALGFMVTSFSRRGYSRAITVGVVFGLFAEAYGFSMRGVIMNNVALLWLAFLPIPALLIALFFVRQKTSGRTIMGRKS